MHFYEHKRNLYIAIFQGHVRISRLRMSQLFKLVLLRERSELICIYESGLLLFFAVTLKKKKPLFSQIQYSTVKLFFFFFSVVVAYSTCWEVGFRAQSQP